MSKLVPKYTQWEAIDIALSLSRQALELARTPGPQGLAGKDGSDGIGFDDIDERYEDKGRIYIRTYLRQGKVFKEFRHQTNTPIFRGVHDADRVYQPGDMVSRSGSQWHCNEECQGLFNGDFWTLSVKQGRDRKPD